MKNSIGFSTVTTIKQRHCQPESQPLTLEKIYPIRKQLMVKRSQRCKVCNSFYFELIHFQKFLILNRFASIIYAKPNLIRLLLNLKFNSALCITYPKLDWWVQLVWSKEKYWSNTKILFNFSKTTFIFWRKLTFF